MSGNDLSSGIIKTADSPYAAFHPAPISSVTMKDGFWKARMERNRKVAIPELLNQLEKFGRIENFRIAHTRTTADRAEKYPRDSDTFKWLEACALVLESGDDPELRQAMDRIVDWVISAQHEDGYLNTYYTGALADQRWSRLRSHHELYCAGHLIQAAIAHRRATGETRLFDCAVRFADLICDVFGPGKIEEADGHPEPELAFIELYRVTGQRKYLDIAKFWLDVQKYNDKQEIDGHAVMAMYLSSGATDYYLETGDLAVWETVQRLWKDFIRGKVYLTGGTGARHITEAIGVSYELPNERAYAETCAAIGNALWSLRLLGITQDCSYADMMERALYNGFLGSISQSGTEYFYCCPLASYSEYHRNAFYSVACCPTNVARTFAAIPSYMYGLSNDGSGVWVHMFDNSEITFTTPSGQTAKLEQQSEYPWSGDIRFTVTVDSPDKFIINIRIPDWTPEGTFTIDGVQQSCAPGHYLALDRQWKSGDSFTLSLEMPPVLVRPNGRLENAHGCYAIQRGPLVYCVESVDNPGIPVRDIALDGDPQLWISGRLGDLDDIVVISGAGAIDPTEDLYLPLNRGTIPCKSDVQFKAIPFYVWGNRGKSQMKVWIRRVLD